jgi:cytoskeletal protein CcmA (bactofilin family)
MRRRRSVDWIQRPPTIVQRDMVYVGDIRTGEDLLVRGKVLGNGDIRGTVIMNPESCWIGDLSADVVVVSGWVAGNVIGRVKLELRDPGRIYGNAASPQIALADQARIIGRIDAQGELIRFHERRHRGWMSGTPRSRAQAGMP